VRSGELGCDAVHRRLAGNGIGIADQLKGRIELLEDPLQNVRRVELLAQILEGIVIKNS